MAGRPAAFLDRDGVLNDVVPDPVSGLHESPLRAVDVRLAAGAAAGARRLASAGFVLVQVSNQPAAAKGKVTVEDLHSVQARVEELLAEQGVVLELALLCLHHPDGIVPRLSGDCACRKPRPGMLLDAAARLDLDLSASWVAGDGDADIGAARAARTRVALVEHPHTAHRRGRLTPDARAADLEETAKLIAG